MYLMYGDEADAEQGLRQKFFLYGGIFIEQSKAWAAHQRIEKLRKKAGFAAQDSLKFATNTRPGTVTAETHRDIKSAVIDLAQELGVIFCAYVFLHAIGRSQEQSDLIEFGANTVLGKFNQFLAERNEFGVAKLDRMGKNAFDYAKEKFQRGLIFANREVRLDHIISVGFCCDGASHLSSMADIVLGSFRYCVNEEDKDIAGKAMLPKLVPLLWQATAPDGNRYVRERGITLRPKDVQRREHQEEFDALIARLESYAA